MRALFIAALCPGMPLDAAAAARARAADQHVVDRGLDPPRPDLLALLGERPRRSRWKMFPPGSPSSASSSTGVRASRHGSPAGVMHRQSSIGSASTLFKRLQRRRDRLRLGLLRASPANSRAGMCSPKHVSVCAPASRSSAPRIEGSVSEWQ